jgi:hypothetical protein
LTHSPYTAGYEICAEGACQPLTGVMPGLPEIEVVEVRPCAAAQTR